jgi:hypothetical protein
MLSLFKSEQFQKEYQKVKQQIDDSQDQVIKAELTKLLKLLVSEVKAIDQQHQELAGSMRLSNTVNDHKSNLLDIRKKISSLLGNN